MYKRQVFGDDSLFGDEPTTEDKAAEPTVFGDDSLFGDEPTNEDKAAEPTVFGDDSLFGDEPTTEDKAAEPTVFGDDSLFGDEPATEDKAAEPTAFGDDSLFGDEPTNEDKAAEPTVFGDDSLLGDEPTNEDKAAEPAVFGDDSSFSDLNAGALDEDEPLSVEAQDVAEALGKPQENLDASDNLDLPDLDAGLSNLAAADSAPFADLSETNNVPESFDSEESDLASALAQEQPTGVESFADAPSELDDLSNTFNLDDDHVADLAKEATPQAATEEAKDLASVLGTSLEDANLTDPENDLGAEQLTATKEETASKEPSSVELMDEPAMQDIPESALEGMAGVTPVEESLAADTQPDAPTLEANDLADEPSAVSEFDSALDESAATVDSADEDSSFNNFSVEEDAATKDAEPKDDFVSLLGDESEILNADETNTENEPESLNNEYDIGAVKEPYPFAMYENNDSTHTNHDWYTGPVDDINEDVANDFAQFARSLHNDFGLEQANNDLNRELNEEEGESSDLNGFEKLDDSIPNSGDSVDLILPSNEEMEASTSANNDAVFDLDESNDILDQMDLDAQKENDPNNIQHIDEPALKEKAQKLDEVISNDFHGLDNIEDNKHNIIEASDDFILPDPENINDNSGSDLEQIDDLHQALGNINLDNISSDDLLEEEPKAMSEPELAPIVANESALNANLKEALAEDAQQIDEDLKGDFHGIDNIENNHHDNLDESNDFIMPEPQAPASDENSELNNIDELDKAVDKLNLDNVSSDELLNEEESTSSLVEDAKKLDKDVHGDFHGIDNIDNNRHDNLDETNDFIIPEPQELTNNSGSVLDGIDDLDLALDNIDLDNISNEDFLEREPSENAPVEDASQSSENEVILPESTDSAAQETPALEPSAPEFSAAEEESAPKSMTPPGGVFEDGSFFDPEELALGDLLDNEESADTKPTESMDMDEDFGTQLPDSKPETESAISEDSFAAPEMDEAEDAKPAAETEALGDAFASDFPADDEVASAPANSLGDDTFGAKMPEDEAASADDLFAAPEMAEAEDAEPAAETEALGDAFASDFPADDEVAAAPADSLDDDIFGAEMPEAEAASADDIFAAPDMDETEALGDDFASDFPAEDEVASAPADSLDDDIFGAKMPEAEAASADDLFAAPEIDETEDAEPAAETEALGDDFASDFHAEDEVASAPANSLGDDIFGGEMPEAEDLSSEPSMWDVPQDEFDISNISGRGLNEGEASELPEDSPVVAPEAAPVEDMPEANTLEQAGFTTHDFDTSGTDSLDSAPNDDFAAGESLGLGDDFDNQSQPFDFNDDDLDSILATEHSGDALPDMDPPNFDVKDDNDALLDSRIDGSDALADMLSDVPADIPEVIVQQSGSKLHAQPAAQEHELVNSADTMPDDLTLDQDNNIDTSQFDFSVFDDEDQDEQDQHMVADIMDGEQHHGVDFNKQEALEANDRFVEDMLGDIDHGK